MNTFFADYTKNISKGGTFIKTEHPLPVGTRFVFSLSLPSRVQPFELMGVVVWTNQSGDVRRTDIGDHGMGVRFVFVDEPHRLAFEREVEDLIAKSAGAIAPYPSRNSRER